MSVKVDNEKCIGCGACLDACPVNALEIINGKAVINNNCAECGACISACPIEAIS
jgi:ferredoxin